MAPGQASEILAQVGALMKSRTDGNPLAGLAIRKMILAGTSASAAVLINYLPAHIVYRRSDMSVIYDGSCRRAPVRRSAKSTCRSSRCRR